MRRIFSSAETVLAWLGDNDYTDVFEAFEKFSIETRQYRLSAPRPLEWRDDLELFRGEGI